MDYTASYYNIIIKENEQFVWLYNSYSGALAKLERQVYESITDAKIDSDKPCLYFDKLLAQGFIKPLQFNEFNKMAIEEKRAIYETSKRSLTFVIAPTLACNLNCVYCFESSVRNKQGITDETLTEIVKFIERSISTETETIHITWFGGEPLLVYDKIKKFYEMLREIALKHNIKYTSSMITNGTLLDADKAEYLSKNCSFKNVQITIDGTEETYCKQKKATREQFYRVFENIKNALPYFNVTIRFNGDRDNFEDIKIVTKQLIEYCGKHKNLNLYLARILDYDSGIISDNIFCQNEFDIKHYEFEQYVSMLLGHEFRPRLPKYRKNFCGLFKLKNLVIGPEGEIYKCEHFVGRQEKIIGNVWQGIFYTDDLFAFLENKTPEKCKTCKLFPLCIGGCPAQKEVLQESERCSLSMESLKLTLLRHMEIIEKK